MFTNLHLLRLCLKLLAKQTGLTPLACSGKSKLMKKIVLLLALGICPDPEDFTCHLRESCVTPWGTRIPNGAVVTAYRHERTPYACEAQVRRCEEGHLTGSYEYDSCVSTADEREVPY